MPEHRHFYGKATMATVVASSLTTKSIAVNRKATLPNTVVEGTLGVNKTLTVHGALDVKGSAKFATADFKTLDGTAITGGTINGTTITGGTINDTAVGATTKSTGAFTALSASDNTSIDGTLSVGTSTATATLTAAIEKVGDTDYNVLRLSQGSGDGSVKLVNLTTPVSGDEENVAATKEYVDSAASNATFGVDFNKIIRTTGTVSAGKLETTNASITGGAISGTTIGKSNPSTGDFTQLSASGDTTLASLSASGNTSIDGTLSVGTSTATATLTAAIEKVGDTDYNVLRLSQGSGDGDTSGTSVKLVNLTTPVSGDSGSVAATKGYVDSVASGLDVKQSCRVATTAALATPLTSNLVVSGGAAAVDGVTLAAGDRVLVKNQSNANENGIYIVGAVGGAATRAADFSIASQVAGAFTFIEEGTTHANKGFVCTSPDASDLVGTNALNFAQFSSSGAIEAGTGLTKSGSVFNVVFDDGFSSTIRTTGTISAGEFNVNTDKMVVKKATGNTTIAGTLDVQGQTTLAVSSDIKRGEVGVFERLDDLSRHYKLSNIARNGSGYNIGYDSDIDKIIYLNEVIIFDEINFDNTNGFLGFQVGWTAQRIRASYKLTDIDERLIGDSPDTGLIAGKGMHRRWGIVVKTASGVYKNAKYFAAFGDFNINAYAADEFMAYRQAGGWTITKDDTDTTHLFVTRWADAFANMDQYIRLLHMRAQPGETKTKTAFQWEEYVSNVATGNTTNELGKGTYAIEIKIPQVKLSSGIYWHQWIGSAVLQIDDFIPHDPDGPPVHIPVSWLQRGSSVYGVDISNRFSHSANGVPYLYWHTYVLTRYPTTENVEMVGRELRLAFPSSFNTTLGPIFADQDSNIVVGLKRLHSNMVGGF